MKFTSALSLLSRTTRPLTAACLATLLLALLASAPAARASNSCSNELFRTGPGANLPDCRAYEMVSPPEKNGGEIDGGLEFETIPAPMQAALNGEAVTYGSQTVFATTNPVSGALTSQYLSRRGPEGWTSEQITPAQDFPGGVFDKSFGSEEFSPFIGFSEDLEYAFLRAYEPSPVPGAPAGYYNPYLRDNADNSYRLLSNVTPPVEPPGPADDVSPGFSVEYAGMSADGSAVVFSANDALTPGALPGSLVQGEITSERNLYESRDGSLELVSVLPKSEGGEAVNAWFGAPVSAENVNLQEDGNRVVSRDGSRVIWTAPAVANGGASQLYMHERTPAGPRTVHVSASRRIPADPAGPRAAHYWTASVDDRYVFFSSCEKLTGDATAEAGECYYLNGKPSVNGEDLYRYDADTGELKDLTTDPHPGQTANVQAVLGASENGAYVYFVARGALVQGAPSGSDDYNIYVWHEGETRLIATTTSSKIAGGDYFSQKWEESEELLLAGLTRVSPNGRYLAFESTEPLTGYHNEPLQAEACLSIGSVFLRGSVYANGTGRCIEVYEYDAAAGRLSCVSCNPTGLPPVGNSVVPMPAHLSGGFGGWQSTTVQQRYLLDDGRLFFDSTDELVPQASNGGEFNVYEYEPAGLGSCQREGGCIGLISSGTSNANSLFMDASASGDDVFFITRQALVAQDGDDALDVYDARVNGGFQAPPVPPCGGEACRPPVTPVPAIYQAPPSATFVGPGNPAPAAQPAAPGGKKVKVKPKKASRKRARKHKHAAPKHGRRAALRSSARGTTRGGLR